jgi:hypothetical protein
MTPGERNPGHEAYSLGRKGEQIHLKDKRDERYVHIENWERSECLHQRTTIGKITWRDIDNARLGVILPVNIAFCHDTGSYVLGPYYD